MLTVYSALGSPGASTTAMYLAAHWASTGQEVLLIEADPAGGSLSHRLGVQFTPGSASLVASGLPALGGNLVDHCQDVLFESLHVMPSTSSPTGARAIVRWFAERAWDLRKISAREMAVVIDGGRFTADAAASPLTVSAAGVIVVARGESSRQSLEYIGETMSADSTDGGPERGVVTIGDSPWSAAEWEENCGLTFFGSITEWADVTGDLQAFLSRNKRKAKKWRVSLEQVGERLFPYAHTAGSGTPRPGAEPVQQPAPPSDVVEARSVPPAQPAPYLAPPPVPEPEPVSMHHPPPPPAQPAHHEIPQPPAPPPAHADVPPQPPAAPPMYFERPPPPPDPVYSGHDPAAVPVYHPPPPAAPPPPGHQPPAPPAAPPPDYAAPPPWYEPPPVYHPPPAHGQPVTQPPADDHPQPGSPPPPPAQVQHPAPTELPEPPPLPEITPSGSFRDWAARLHGSAPQGGIGTGSGEVS